MTPSANKMRWMACWLLLALVAAAAPTFAADRTVEGVADSPLAQAALETGMPVIAYVQIGALVLTAVWIADAPEAPIGSEGDDTQPAQDDKDSDSDKNSVILEDGAPF